MTALHGIDFYKADHRSQYPKNTETVVSNWTPRKSRIKGINNVVFFGLQYHIQKYLIEEWNSSFFNKPQASVVADYKRRMHNAGLNISTNHIKELHDFGKLPISIWALPEGEHVPIGVPMFLMWNTHPNFSWLTNYLETSMSATLWGPCTSATIAYRYRQIFEYFAKASGGDLDFVNWQGHDFSARGMFGNEAAAMSAAAHLLSFTGTDTVSAIDFLEKYYQADSDLEIVGGSVPATEHSVMCMGSKESEIETFRRLITDIYPTGTVSIVSDTWDYWKVWTEILPQLKNEILNRDGKVVIRPDSGDPVKILCGDPNAEKKSPAYKGSFKLAWELFGGTTNSKGLKVLDPHIGLIYGDSITLERAREICSSLMIDKFVPNPVLGIGSYTYQYNTRDTFGFAIKATAGRVDGEMREIFKDPVTDSGEKKSAKGLLAVYRENGRFKLKQQVTWDEVLNCAFEEVFTDGEFLKTHKLEDIRKRVQAGPNASIV